jgi:ribose 5-phosphate isomerase A
VSEDDPLAAAALAEIDSGATIGLGTGRSAERAVRALARKTRAEGLRVTCVATSEATLRLARELDLVVLPIEQLEHLDLVVDGADEVDPALRMLKGRGGAMTREKIAAHAASRRVYLVHEEKLVRRLGQRAPLPIEILRFGLAATLRRLRELGLEGSLRPAGYRTDDGNPVFDATLRAGTDLVELASALDRTLGAVGHGLFLSEADVVLVEGAPGTPIQRLTRGAAPGPGDTPRPR